MSETVRSKVVLPGDPVSISTEADVIKAGPGVSVEDDGIAKSTLSGVLGVHEKGAMNQYWIHRHHRRYTKSAGDPVVGVVVGRNADGFRVDIGTSQHAHLDAMAFENATKRNKPNLKIGSLVYAYVMPTPPDFEPEVVCLNPSTMRAEGYGELKGGTLIRDVDISRCRLLLVKSSILEEIGKSLAFETAVGLNGMIWVKLADEDEHRMPQLVQQLKEGNHR